MLRQLYTYLLSNKKKAIFLFVGLSLSLLVAGSINHYGFLLPTMVLALAIVVAFLAAAFGNPRFAFWVYLAYCFALGFFVKLFPTIPVGLAMDAVLILTWVSILIHRKKVDWGKLQNEHVLFSLLWFLISLLQILNPAGGSLVAALNEIRFTAVSWLLIAPLTFLLFNRTKDLNKFIVLIIALSAVATLYGIKQLYFGVSANEQLWLDGGANQTHILKGEFRAFSMYSDAGQFGASQAIMAVIALVLALGPFKLKYKLIFGVSALLFLYGMGISGTRGALFGLGAGLGYALFLSKNFKLLFVGALLALGCFATLKYTKFGDDIFQINRLRTALDPKDESFKVRLLNQNRLKAFLADMPFGAGLGMSGTNGVKYNAHEPIANIPPDSYWVKVWVMYGVVGLFIWIALNAYIIGKCSGIVWKIKDPKLKAKLIALTAGSVGCFVCSYGNEVMNGMPSSVILFMSWSFVLIGPYLDKESDRLKDTKSDALCP